MSFHEEAESGCGPSDPKRPRIDILWELCIICQTEDKSKHLRENPTEYEKVLNAIHTRGKYGDSLYPEISRKLACISACDMKEKKQLGIKSALSMQQVSCTLTEQKQDTKMKLQTELDQAMVPREVQLKHVDPVGS